MTTAVKITLAASGLFLISGLTGGILKYREMMKSPDHKAHPYIDKAHIASFYYSFTALVMAELLRYSPYTETVQLVITCVPLFFFITAIAQYFKLGIEGKVSQQYRTRNFTTTWGTLILIAGETGGISAIVWGFIKTQFM